MSVHGALPELDLTLLSGFSYSCRPGCGLCCYAEPRVSREEKRTLLTIVPEEEFVSRGRGDFLRTRSEGGACVLLDQRRCTAHLARPAPCREFPLTTHVGTRLQTTVVLTCPGVDLTSLADYAGASRRSPPEGFDSELESVRSRVDRSVPQRIEESSRRRRRIVRELGADGRWEEEIDVRRRLTGAVPRPSPEDFPAEDPPTREDGLELLPLFFAGRSGPVALAASLGGWELFELTADGGTGTVLGIAPPPEQAPRLSPDGERLFRGYLRYWLDRDALFGTVHLAMSDSDEGTVADWVGQELRRIGALVLSRGRVLASLMRGSSGALDAEDVALGIRATDQDLLDRPTWGSRL